MPLTMASRARTEISRYVGSALKAFVADGYVEVFAECADHAKEIYLKRLEDLKQSYKSFSGFPVDSISILR